MDFFATLCQVYGLWAMLILIFIGSLFYIFFKHVRRPPTMADKSLVGESLDS